MTDGTGTTKYVYDQLDRLTESENGHKEIVKYAYDLANDETKITYPNGKTVERAFDKDGVWKRSPTGCQMSRNLRTTRTRI
jgi:YD repeat-containing protein